MKTYSWVILDKNNNAILETYRETTAVYFSKQGYKAVPILEYLQSINKKP